MTLATCLWSHQNACRVAPARLVVQLGDHSTYCRFRPLVLATSSCFVGISGFCAGVSLDKTTSLLRPTETLPIALCGSPRAIEEHEPQSVHFFCSCVPPAHLVSPSVVFHAAALVNGFLPINGHFIREEESFMPCTAIQLPISVRF